MHDYYYKDSITTMLEHCERTQAVKVSQSVHLIFMANCGVRELHCCYTVFNTPKKKKKSIQFIWKYSRCAFWVCYQRSGPFSADTEYVISTEVIQEYICRL